MEWRKDAFVVSDDPARLDLGFMAGALQSEWRKDSTRETLERAISSSLTLAMYDGPKQIGFHRMISDFEFATWFCEIYLEPSYRGKGLGDWLMHCTLIHPKIHRTRITTHPGAHVRGLFDRFGFKVMKHCYTLRPGAYPGRIGEPEDARAG